MNKTIIINMNGIIFHIEEDAYEQLKAYMSSVKRHFAYTPDSEEIVSDIENRIAEMFNELLAAKKKQVIATKDVEAVTAQMGAVSDFESAEGTHEDPVISEVRSDKRLFRDSDDRIIGGVCSGIGHYFGISAKWIRLIFIVPGMLFFIGVFAYIVLWIAMPKARNRAEKMAMKGEKLNLQNFKRNFDEEVEAVRSNRVVNQASGFFRDLLAHLFLFVGRIGRFILKLICGVIILSGLAAVVALFVTLLILMGNSSLESSEVFAGLAMVNPEYRSPIFFSAFVLAIIPLTALVLFAIRVLFNHKIVTRTGIFAMLIIWLTGLGIGIFYGARVASNFSEEASFTQVVPLSPSAVYALSLEDSRIFSHEDSVRYDLKDGVPNAVGGNHSYHFNQPGVNIYVEESAPGEQATLTKKFIASGQTFDDALANAKAIRYSFFSKDSVLRLSSTGQMDKEQLWREQRIVLTLKVPKNTVLKIQKNLNDYIRGYDIPRCSPEGSPWKEPAEWIMREEGLKCLVDSLNEADEEGQ